MSQKAGRNDLCPCGSGKKMKACHPEGVTPASKNRNLIIIGAVVAVVAVSAAAMMRETPPPMQSAPTRPSTMPVNNATAPATQGAGTPQPGPAPPGKVWSPEHGHWHDDPAAGAAGAAGAAASRSVQVNPGQNQPLQIPSPQNPNQARPNTPQPPGPAPEGKVWSPEHGHWHDAPKTNTAPATPAQGSGPN